MEILVEDFMGFAELDRWQEGCDPDTGRTTLHEKVGESFDDIDDLINWFYKTYNLTDDKQNWGIFSIEDGRIEVTQYEDDNGYRVDTNDHEYDLFKTGEIDLWLVNYSIYVKFIEAHVPTYRELQHYTGLQLV